MARVAERGKLQPKSEDRNRLLARLAERCEFDSGGGKSKLTGAESGEASA